MTDHRRGQMVPGESLNWLTATAPAVSLMPIVLSDPGTGEVSITESDGTPIGTVDLDTGYVHDADGNIVGQVTTPLPRPPSP